MPVASRVAGDAGEERGVDSVSKRLRTDDEAIQRDVRLLAVRIARMATQARWLAAESRAGEYLRLWLVNKQAQQIAEHAQQIATIAARARRRYELRKDGEQ